MSSPRARPRRQQRTRPRRLRASRADYIAKEATLHLTSLPNEPSSPGIAWSRNVPPASFAFFPLLPVELRHCIFEIATHFWPRVVQHTGLDPYNTMDTRRRGLLPVRQSLPRLLQVNRDSRAVTLRLYSILFGGVSLDPTQTLANHTPDDLQNHNYFYPSIDTLWFVGPRDLDDYQGVRPTLIGVPRAFTDWLTTVQRLYIDTEWMPLEIEELLEVLPYFTVRIGLSVF